MQPHVRRFGPLVTLILLSLACGQSHGSEDGFILGAGIGHAEGGNAVRSSLEVGYLFASGWGLHAASQRLQERFARVTSIELGIPNTVSVEEKSAEVRSEAFALSFGWRVGRESPWRTRIAVGAHDWKINDFVLPYHVEASGFDPYVRIEATRALTRRISIGVAAERFWLDLGDITRGSGFVRVRFGGSD